MDTNQANDSVIKTIATDVGKEITVDSKDFIDTFINTQKCIVKNEMPAMIASGEAKNAPSAEQLEQAIVKLDEKSADKANTDAAWKDISTSCNGDEVSSMHKFFDCHKSACGSSDLKAAEAKHRECGEPQAGEACRKAFDQFAQRFFPF